MAAPRTDVEPLLTGTDLTCSFGATPAQSRVAHVVHRAYFLIWQQLRSG